MPSLNNSTIPGQVLTVVTEDPDGDFVLVGTVLNQLGMSSSESLIGNSSIIPGKNVKISICTVDFLKRKVSIHYIPLFTITDMFSWSERILNKTRAKCHVESI